MRVIRSAFLAAAIVLFAGVLAEPARGDVSFDFAYSNLSQHGSWLVSAQYGRVWQPREYRREWNPYYDGHWVDTDMGWAWVSDYEWGSIPYHYGTWFEDPRFGWVWIPGEVWAPSWVVFRTSPEYIGWFPVPPGFSVGVSIEFGPPSSFIYVSSRDFLAPRLRGSIIPRERTNVFVNNTTVVNNIVIQNNIVINRGPDVRTVERATGQTVRSRPIEQVARVAPFDHVSRAQLAVAPERVERGLRVAEPVPESHPLPVAEQRGRAHNKKDKESAPASQPRNAAAPREREVQAPSGEANPVEPSNPNEPRHNEPTAADPQKAHRAPAPRHEATPVTPSGQVEQRQSKPPEDHGAPSPKPHDRQPNTNPRAKPDAPEAHHAEPSPHDAAVVAPNPANSQANPEQRAEPQHEPKANTDAKAKKDHPGKKDKDRDQGTTPDSQ
jgi:hypothetical protein